MQNRSGRLILNSIYSLLAWLLPILLGLLVTPFLVRRLGVQAYGLYLVILGLIGYSFTFSVSRAVAKFVSEFKASADIQKINSTITAALYISLAMGIFGSVATVLLAEWAVKDLLQIADEFQRTATVALMIGGFSIPLMLLSQVFQSILQGSNRFASLSVLTNVQWFLLNAGNISLVVCGFGIDALLAWTVVVAGIVATVSFVVARRAEPAFGIAIGSAGEMLGPVASYGASVFLYQVFGSLILLVERAWITRNFGTETAAYYVVPMALTMYFHGFISNLTAAVFPAMNELLSDRQRLLELYKKSTKLVVALAVLFLLTIYFDGRSFLSLWIDPDFAENSYKMLFIHAATFGLMGVLIIMWHVNEVFGAARINSLLSGIWAFITILLIVFVSKGWEAEGVALARLIGVAVTMPAVFLVERLFLGGSQWRFWGRLTLQILAAALALALVEYILSEWSIANRWLGLAAGSIAGAVTYFVVLGITGFVTQDEKEMIRRLLRLENHVLS